MKPELLQRFLEPIVASGADSIGLLGSTGGYAYLTPEARKRTLRAAVECVAGRTPLIVGVGALTTDFAEDLARDAREAGADGLLLAPMSYQPLTDEEVFRHFEAVATAGELPLGIYNNPGTTKFSFSPDLIARLAELPNLTARPGNDVLFQRIFEATAATVQPILSAMISEGVADGTFDVADPALTAEVIIGLSQGRRQTLPRVLLEAMDGEVGAAAESLNVRMVAEGLICDRLLGVSQGSVAISSPAEYRRMLVALAGRDTTLPAAPLPSSPR